MPCQARCLPYKATKPLHGSYYSIAKRCQECVIFIKWEGLNCPCCGQKLRTRPRNNEYRNKCREERELKASC